MLAKLMLMFAILFILSVFMTPRGNMFIRGIGFEVFEPKHVSAGPRTDEHRLKRVELAQASKLQRELAQRELEASNSLRASLWRV